MDIDSFFLSGHAMADSILGTVTMAVAGQSFQVVIDDVTKQTTGEDIGLMGEFALVAMAQAAAVTNPKALINKRCTVDGSPYRISAVRAGSVAVSFTLQDPAQS
jgi:hypothetical protein